MFVGLQESSRYSCNIVMNLEFLRHILEKHINIKCREHLFSGGRVVTCRTTDGGTNVNEEASSRFS